MVKKIVILVLTFALKINAQVNLVMNPGFENYTSCPNGPAELPKCIGWTHNGSSDYFNTCAPYNQASIPNNWGGFQQAASGSGYAAIITYYSQSLNFRELISQNLLSPLVIGTKYFVSFRTSLSLGFVENANSATNKIGAMFRKVPLTGFSAIITNNPPIYSNAVINDSLNWTKVFGSFVSDSSYTHIVLGNFFDDNNTNINQVYPAPVNHAYYYIDDVCVSTDSSFASNFVTGISENHENDMIGIFPNPAYDRINVSTTYLINNFEILNIHGEIILEGLMNSSSLNISVTNLNDGVYLLRLNKKYSSKFLIVK